MKNLFKSLIALLVVILPTVIYGATGNTTNSSDVLAQTGSLAFCGETYEITGPSAIKANSSHEYQITQSGGLDFTGNVIYTLLRDNKTIESVDDRNTYLRYFSSPGKVELEARVFGTIPACSGVIKKEIQVYKSVVVYLGNNLAGLEAGMEEVLEKNSILLKSFAGTATPSQGTESQEIWGSIEQSDTLIVGSSDILGFFSDIVKLQKIKPIIFSKKKIYVISNFSKPFLSKVLASSLSQIGAMRVFLISEDQVYGILARISTNTEDTISIGSELSYEKKKTVYSLNGFIEFLAYAGFSYQLLAFLLSITFVVLVLNIFKQIIGFNVFGIYYPVLFAITIATLGFYGSLVFVTIGFASILAVNLFARKIHLLLHAKRALLISIYIMLFLLILGVDNYFEIHLIDYAIFSNPLVIFPLFVTVIIADKAFQEDINIFSKSGVFDFIQYAMVTTVAYLCFEYKGLQYFLISYPDIAILVVLLNVLVGRYTGLQLFEYFRFAPLLKKLNEEE